MGGMAIRNRVEAKKLDALDVAICYDLTVITEPKTFHIHFIPAKSL
jgi:hypothetical protein